MPSVLLHEIAGSTSIVQGADNTVAVNERLIRVPNGTVVRVRGTITHDQTITLKNKTDVHIVPETPGDGFQTLTDTGGLEPKRARIRAHVSIEYCTNSGVCDLLDIGGTHPESGPNSSPDNPGGDPSRDIWEGQALVRILASKGSVVRANLHHGWGDFVETDALAPRPGQYFGNSDTLILGGDWHRNGRVAVKVAGNKGLRWQGTLITKCVGEKFHIESGNNRDQADLFMQNVVTDGFGRSLVGISGGSRIDGLAVTDCVQLSGCIQVGATGPTRSLLGIGAAKFTRFRFWNLRWRDPESGGAIAKFTNIDGLDYGTNCGGPVRRVVQEKLQFRFESCRDLHVDLSGITRV